MSDSTVAFNHEHGGEYHVDKKGDVKLKQRTKDRQETVKEVKQNDSSK